MIEPTPSYIEKAFEKACEGLYKTHHCPVDFGLKCSPCILSCNERAKYDCTKCWRDALLKSAGWNELKACPHCGSLDSLIVDTNSHDFRVYCNPLQGGCGANGGRASSAIEAIKNWNRRA